MDLKTYLRQLILLPKTGIEIKRDEYNYPEKTINFLNLVRDHYTKYQTTFALFYPSALNTSLLAQGGNVLAYEKAALLYASSFPPPKTSFQLDADLPDNLRMFLIATTLGYVSSGQVMTSPTGARYISTNLDKNAIINRVLDKGTSSTVLVAGVNTIVVTPPPWWVDVNGTTVMSSAVIPSGDDVVASISAILAEAYAYYDVSTLPVLNVSDIYTVNSPYIFRKVVDKMTTTRTPIPFLSTVRSVIGANFYQRFLGTCMTQGTGVLGKMVQGINEVNALANGNPIVDMGFIAPFLDIFGDWFTAKVDDVFDLYGNSFQFVSGNDPFLCTETSKGWGYYYQTTNGKIDMTQVSGSFYIKNNVFHFFNGSTNVEVDMSMFSTIFKSPVDNQRFTIANTIKQIVIYRKDTGNPIDYFGGKLNPDYTMDWITPIINKAATYIKNGWIGPGPDVSPYVKIFTSGKVTLSYLQSIQVRDTILVTEKGTDLFLFPNFLITDPAFLTPDPYNPLNLRVDSVSIKILLAAAIDYITTQLFAQDIATLNVISGKFDFSITVNNAAKARLDSEYVKMNQLNTDLNVQLVEATRVDGVYTVLQNSLAALADPVLTIQQQLQAKMDAELALYTTQEQAQIANDIAAALYAKNQAILDAAAAAAAAAAEATRLAAVAEAKRLADLAEAQRLADVAEAQRLADIATAKQLADVAAAQLAANQAETSRLAAIAEATRLADLASAQKLADIAEVQRQAAIAEAVRQAAIAESIKQAAIDQANIAAEAKRQADIAEAKRIADLKYQTDLAAQTAQVAQAAQAVTTTIPLTTSTIPLSAVVSPPVNNTIIPSITPVIKPTAPAIVVTKIKPKKINHRSLMRTERLAAKALAKAALLKPQVAQATF